MTDIGNIISNGFPPNIDRTTDIFKTFVANYELDKITSANLKDLGLMERVIYDAQQYCKKIYGTTDFFNLDTENIGDLEEYLFKHFIAYICLPQTKYFTISRTMQLSRILFQRDEFSSWGTRKNLEFVFSNIFNCEAHVVENSLTLEDSLIVNGSFEDGDDVMDGWNSNADNPVTQELPFCGSYSPHLYTNQYISQTVTLNQNEKYNLMFFLIGKIKITIKNSSGQYWDEITNSWVESEKFTTLYAETYTHETINFKNEADEVVTFTFESLIDSSFIDYVRLFQAKYPCFDVLLISGSASEVTTKDLIYDNSYFNISYINGTSTGFSKDLQEFLLNHLRAVGVKGVYERLTVSPSVLEAYVDGTTLVLPSYGDVTGTTLNTPKTTYDKIFNA